VIIALQLFIYYVFAIVFVCICHCEVLLIVCPISVVTPISSDHRLLLVVHVHALLFPRTFFTTSCLSLSLSKSSHNPFKSRFTNSSKHSIDLRRFLCNSIHRASAFFANISYPLHRNVLTISVFSIHYFPPAYANSFPTNRWSIFLTPVILLTQLF